MSIYFEFISIEELMEQCYREQMQFTLSELAQYNGSNGKPAYVAINDIVYDVSKEIIWSGGKHFNLMAGKDLTKEFYSCHGMSEILTKLNKVGLLVKDFNKDVVMNVSRVPEETYDFSPDDWINYLTPIVDDALAEADEGINYEHLFQKYILSGVLVGKGMSPEAAVQQVSEWENTGMAQLLNVSMRNKKSKKLNY